MPSIAPLLAEVPGVWLADELGQGARSVLPTGHPGLDVELPGGGWPLASVNELLQAQAGQHEWRLLLPALARSSQVGHVVLIGAPHQPQLSALASQGLACERLWRIDTPKVPERLWTAEQGLRCPDVAALMLWLPQARPEALRRLQLACQARPQTGASPPGPLLFVMRPLDAAASASPAPLRLALHSRGQAGLEVRLLKRQGPPREQALTLPAELPVHQVLHVLRPRATARIHPLPARHALDRVSARHA